MKSGRRDIRLSGAFGRGRARCRRYYWASDGLQERNSEWRRGENRDGSFYENIGVDFEFPSLYEKLTARENLRFFASLYKRSLDADELLKSVGLLNDADKRVSDFSKGMKSRLNFIKALIHDPKPAVP